MRKTFIILAAGVSFLYWMGKDGVPPEMGKIDEGMFFCQRVVSTTGTRTRAVEVCHTGSNNSGITDEQAISCRPFAKSAAADVAQEEGRRWFDNLVVKNGKEAACNAMSVNGDLRKQTGWHDDDRAHTTSSWPTESERHDGFVGWRDNNGFQHGYSERPDMRGTVHCVGPSGQWICP